MKDDRVKILLVDDQPAKLLSYVVILKDLDEVLITANSAREALAHLLKTDIAIVLVDVCMPDLDGFELAAMIREHPRFEKVAIIFISAIHLTELDRLKGYECGAVDYIPVPVVPEILRAKVRAFADLHRKTRQLERLNLELERRVIDRTAELNASNLRLQDSENRLRLAQDAGGVVTWAWENETGAIVWSKGIDRLLGRGAGEPLPTYTGFLQAVHPEDRARVQSELEDAFKGEGSYESEFRVVWPDGRVRWLAGRGDVVRDGAGKLLRVMGVNFDVTDRREATEALSRLNEDLEKRIEERTQQLAQLQKTEALGQLTAGVAHDFNNLLAAVQSSLEVLRLRLGNDPKAQTMVECAMKGADRGAALTRRMLAFARQQDLKPEAVDISELVHGMIDLLQRSLGPAIRIKTRFPPHLARAFVDPHQLELAILNLAVNGRDAMPSGGLLTISAGEEVLGAGDASSLPPGCYIRLCVSDTGLGMDPPTALRATEPFFTTKGVGKGTGLGLSMVHGLALQSGGQVRIDSKPGNGTTVELWLPRSKITELLAAKAEEPTMQSGRLCTILVVDDDALVRFPFVAVLEDLGHTVLEASSGEEALRLLRGGCAVDLVITDQGMPGMTGVQLIGAIRDLGLTVKTVLASGYGELPPEAAEIPRLNKPFRDADLAAMIAAASATPTNNAADHMAAMRP